MSEKIVHNETIFLNNLILKELPTNFKTKYSLDVSNTDITYLPEGLEVGGDLILNNVYIEELPEKCVIGGNVITDRKDIFIPKDAIIGGKVLTAKGEKPYMVSSDHILTIINNQEVETIIFKQAQQLKTQINVPDIDFWYPTIYYYKNIYNKEKNAVSYTDEEGQVFYLPCSSVKNAYFAVDSHRATRRGIDKYQNYDIDEKRTVVELIEIYRVCTGACTSGINRFLEEFQIDMNKKYSIREVRRMVMRLPFPGGSAKMVFLEYFNPEKWEQKEEAN